MEVNARDVLSNLEDFAEEIETNGLMMKCRSTPFGRGPKPYGTGPQDPRYRRMAGGASLAESFYYCDAQLKARGEKNDKVEYIRETGYPTVMKMRADCPDDAMSFMKREGNSYGRSTMFSLG